MVTAEEIVELGFMPYKIKRGNSIFYISNETDIIELTINLNTGRYKIEINDEETSKGKVSSINELEDRIQDGEY